MSSRYLSSEQPILYPRPPVIEFSHYVHSMRILLNSDRFRGNPDTVTVYMLPTVSVVISPLSLWSPRRVIADGISGVAYAMEGNGPDGKEWHQRLLAEDAAFEFIRYEVITKDSELSLTRDSSQPTPGG